MKRFPKKSLCLLVVAMLLLTTVAGCKKQSTAGVTDPSKLPKVQLQFYLMGDAPQDLPTVEGKINDIATKSLNCTVKFNFTTWTDYTQKYALCLTSGQPIDLIYTASWLDYQKYAKQGAFLALDKMLSTDCPDLQKFVDPSLWNGVKVNGKIYTVPATYKEYSNTGLLYRQDLQEKYKLPVPDSLANVEAYMLGVHKADPSQIISCEGVTAGPVGMSFGTYELLQYKYSWVNLRTPYGLTADYATPSDIKPYWGTDDFKADMKIMKRMADEGLWSRSALASTDNTTAFDDGKDIVTISGENYIKFQTSQSKAQSAHPDWKVAYYPYANTNGVAYMAHPTQNGTGVPFTSENPDRALMFLQKLTLDKTMNQLAEYGVQGKNYTVENGYYKSVGDATKNGFPVEGMNGWDFRNPSYMLFDSSHDLITKMNTDFDKIAAGSKWKGFDIFDGFAEDYTNYSTQRAALGEVLTQYLAPIEAGLVDDVDAATANFMAKANGAGLADIQKAYTTQWKAYCQQYGFDK